MNINENDVAKLVQQVLQEMTSGAPASAPKAQAAPNGDIPKTAKVAMMTELKHFEIQEYPIPELGDDDILVRVEGCGVCGTDAHEYKNDPFSLIPVVLGHEGTGEIVKMGKNVKKDSAGRAGHLPARERIRGIDEGAQRRPGKNRAWRLGKVYQCPVLWIRYHQY